jgi:radical SAM superfamily enzyme YgiQ (UPF0313 family)
MAFVTLIRPPTVVAKWSHTTPTCPPIGLAYVAAALQQAGHTVEVIDAVGEDVFQMLALEDTRFLGHGLSADQIVERIHPATTHIGISCMFSHEWPLTRAVITRVRRAFGDAVIVAGGEHITAMPEFSLVDCPALDYCVLGEGEEGFAELIEALGQGRSPASVNGLVLRRDGAPARTPVRARIRHIDEIPPPAWSLLPLANYLDNGFGFGVNRGRSMPVLATRGCPYQCTFCSNPLMWTTRWITRDPATLLDEMRGYLERYRIENFDFYDLTAIVKREWIIEFCRLILASGLTFTWQLPSGTRSEAIDGEVSRLLYEAGCRNMSYAPESGSPTVLKRIKKRVDLGRMKQSMRAAVKNGVNIKANIILGFPDETHREVWQTMTIIVEMGALGVHDMSISPFSPYPESELFDDLRKRGRIVELSDAYFYSLATYTDLLRTVSVADRISGRALGLYRLFGMVLFYAVSYAVRPWRLVRTLSNLFHDRQESRLEMSLRDLFFRWRSPKTVATGAGSTR